MNKFKDKLSNLWKWVKTTAKTDKWALIIFCITWVLLESPCIVGLIFYIFTKNYRWMALFLSWFALTATTLPIPVVPISIAVGLAGNKLIKIIKKRSHHDDDESKED